MESGSQHSPDPDGLRRHVRGADEGQGPTRAGKEQKPADTPVFCSRHINITVASR
ncbi:MAG: hypothetical protein FWG40_08230 [Peptococcaceae bacterium]|nr:hypothetical protein [Peptococcaceae bacterium]